MVVITAPGYGGGGLDVVRTAHTSRKRLTLRGELAPRVAQSWFHSKEQQYWFGKNYFTYTYEICFIYLYRWIHIFSYRIIPLSI